MAVVEVGVLLHSSILPLSQIHRKGRYIHLLRTGRRHVCLENRLVCPLLEKNNIRYPLNYYCLKTLCPHHFALDFNADLHHQTGQKDCKLSLEAILPSHINSVHPNQTTPKPQL